MFAMNEIAIAIALLSLIVYLLQRRRHRAPGPWQLPILGYLPWIDEKKPHETLTKLARCYGPVCGLRLGSVYTIILSDPRIIKQTLAKDAFAGRAPLYLTHGIMKGYGLVCAEGELWKDQRRFVSSCFRNFGMLKYGTKRDVMEERIAVAVDECVSKLQERSANGPIDPLDTLHHCMGNFLNDIVMGKVYEEDDKVWKWLRHLQEEGVKEIGVAGPLNFLPFLRFLPRYGRTMRSLIDGKLKTHQIYRKILEEHRERKIEDADKSESFLAAFNREMAKKKPGYFTEEQLFHLLADLFGAGTDTTLTTLRWLLLFMAAYPEQQTKLQDEMDQALRDEGKTTVALDDRVVLPRLEATIAEVQRLRSVTPLGIPHGTTEDTKIDDYDVPKGTMIIPLQWSVHTDPAYWQKPLEFQPERFLAEDGSLVKPEAFLPFQSGKRVCVGEELAKMMLFLFAGKILWTFTVSIPPDSTADLEGECGITLVPKPHRLQFALRR